MSSSGHHRSAESPPPDTPGSGTRLDPWLSNYAERTHGMRASEIRALFSVANRPEVVSLAGGMPHLVSLPLGVIADTTERPLHQRGAVGLQRGSGTGEQGLGVPTPA